MEGSGVPRVAVRGREVNGDGEVHGGAALQQPEADVKYTCSENFRPLNLRNNKNHEILLKRVTTTYK
jgi:hypothetical protein